MADSDTAERTSWYPPVISLGGDDPIPPPPVQWNHTGAASTYRVDSSDLGNRSKLRKVERACDHCRKRKSKCDGPERKDHICSACEANSRTCTYLEDSKPRGPPKAYVAALTDRIGKAEKLLRRLQPELDLAAELGPPLLYELENQAGPSSTSRTRRLQKGSKASSQGAAVDPRRYPVAYDSSSDSEVDTTFPEGTRLTSRGLESSSARAPNDHQLRFQGKSSSLNLISTTMDVIQRELAAVRIADGDSQPPAKPSLSAKLDRPELYHLLPWETRLGRVYDVTDIPVSILSAFPADDVAEKLIHLFFLHEHVTFPLLHRPTFERQWRDKLHLRSVWFTCLCMAVFGLASRWVAAPSDGRANPSAAPEGSGTGALTSFPGWQYISVTIMACAEITEVQSGLLIPPELSEIQTHVLLSQYLRGTVAGDTAWFWLSAGLMKTQDMGLHRRQTYGRGRGRGRPTLEDELWKRAYWHLVALDRFGSVLLGKPFYAREEDLDLDLPLEVDDEYWEGGGPANTSHHRGDKPSLTTAFVCWIKLSHIAMTILKTLYSARKPQRMCPKLALSRKEAIAERLNEMLLEWVDNLPAHLQWRPNMDDTPFASQASTLYATYHLLQALIQRPFLAFKLRRPPPHPTSQNAFAICVHAARASADVAHAQLRRGTGDVVTLLHVLFSAAGVLAVQLWDLVRTASEDAARADARGEQMSALLAEIGRHFEALRGLAPSWELARSMLDDIQRALPTELLGTSFETSLDTNIPYAPSGFVAHVSSEVPTVMRPSCADPSANTAFAHDLAHLRESSLPVPVASQGPQHGPHSHPYARAPGGPSHALNTPGFHAAPPSRRSTQQQIPVLPGCCSTLGGAYPVGDEWHRPC